MLELLFPQQAIFLSTRFLTQTTHSAVTNSSPSGHTKVSTIFIVTVWVILYCGLLHVSVYSVVKLTETLSVQEIAFDPLQPPHAVQVVAFADDHVNITFG